jgi:uncharacterized membrane protein YhhN
MRPAWFLGAYAVVGAANVVGEVTDTAVLADVTKPLLMPLLLAWVLASASRGSGVDRVLRWLIVGIVAAWLGDLLLMGDGDLWFALGLVAFLVMQLCYLRAITAIPGPGLVRAWKIALIPYVLLWLGLNALVLPGAGDMRVPVVVYSTVIIVTALAALDLVLRVPRPLGWRVAFGALVFVVSDALIAMTAFGPLSAAPAWSGIIMATYVIAQAMIVTGLTGCARARATEDVTR